MQRSEEVQALMEIGLTNLQAKVYLTLLKTGNSTVKTIAENTGIVRQEAQRITKELLKLGLIEKVIAYPKEFKPSSLNNAVTILIEQKEKEVKELVQKANFALKTLSNIQDTDATKPPHFLMINSKEAIIRKLKESMNNSSKTIDIINGFGDTAAHTAFILKDETVLLSKKDVKCRVVTNKPCNLLAAERVYKALISEKHKVRYLSSPFPARLRIYDKREVIVDTAPEKKTGEGPVLWTDSPALILAAQAYFNQLWQRAGKNPKNTSKQHNKLCPSVEVINTFA